MSALYRSAYALARKGCEVFPCRPRQKEPATPRGLTDATTDLTIIGQWWAANPTYNIGVVTGSASGFWVLDVDGLEGEATLRHLEAEHGALPASVETITGSGGRHIFFRLAEEPVRNSAGRIGAGLDVRGENGYVISPPSVHPCGGTYCWSVDSAAEFADAPDWLLERLSEPANGKGKMLEEWHSTLSQRIPNGCRNSTLASIAGKLLFHDVNLVLIRDLLVSVNIAQCNPPLPPDEVEAVIISVAQTHLRKRLHG